jgi:hypothetical protein
MRQHGIKIKATATFTKMFWYGKQNWDDKKQPISSADNNRLLIVVEDSIADKGVGYFTQLAKIIPAYNWLVDQTENPHINQQTTSISSNKTISKPKQNPWVSGSFYLFTTILVMIVFAVMSAYLSWYVLPIVVLGGLLAVAIIGAFQLRNDGTLSEKNFIQLMSETFKRMPLLRGSDSSKSSRMKK